MAADAVWRPYTQMQTAPLPLKAVRTEGSRIWLDDGRCHRATNYGGGTCAQDTECVSFLCEDVTGTCAAAPTTAGGLCVD